MCDTCKIEEEDKKIMAGAPVAKVETNVRQNINVEVYSEERFEGALRANRQRDEHGKWGEWEVQSTARSATAGHVEALAAAMREAEALTISDFPNAE